VASHVLEILWGDAPMDFIHAAECEEVRGHWWVRVRTTGGAEGYVSGYSLE
jgi:hypothetical protein